MLGIPPGGIIPPAHLLRQGALQLLQLLLLAPQQRAALLDRTPQLLHMTRLLLGGRSQTGGGEETDRWKGGARRVEGGRRN